jgi:hypothetical protein
MEDDEIKAEKVKMEDEVPLIKVEEVESSTYYDSLDVEQNDNDDIAGEESATTAGHNTTTNTTTTTVVNGIGLWNNFARSFQTSLLAFLDLLDNAIDSVDMDAHRVAATAAFETAGDNAAAQPQQPLAYVDIDGERDGISLINTCAREIPSMRQILELYSSNKIDTPLIGENGIGLKQGCACLSDLSFICTKSQWSSSSDATQPESTFQLGIIAKCLQSETQVLLPSLQFTSANTIREELIEWVQDNDDVRLAVQQYGDQEDLDDAIARLEQTFVNLQDVYPDHPHVYGLFLHHVKQGKGSGSDRSGSLLDEIMDDLPHRYLHIPNTVIVSVRGERIRFCYWQSRLVEMAEFKLSVNPAVLMRDDLDWNSTAVTKSPYYQPQQYCAFRLYIGFDALRVVDRNMDSNPHLYIYSRSSGRQIVRHADARNIIEMGSSGSNYSQGMTILLDDYQTSLPLNPTKQDTAFADCSTGEIFRTNLYMWIRAAVRVYYSRYFDCLYHKKKTPLTEALRALAPTIRTFDPETLTKSMAESHYGSFGNFAALLMGDTIRLAKNASKMFTPGTDVLFRLQGVEVAATATTPVSPLTEKRKAIEAAVATTYDQDEPNLGLRQKKQRHASLAATAATMVKPPFALTSSAFFSQVRGSGRGDDKIIGRKSTKMQAAMSMQLIQRRAAKYEQMKIQKRIAEEQVVDLQKQLTAVQDQNAEMNRDFDQVVQRERMAQDRVAVLERELAAERAQSDERTEQYESDLLDRDDEIIRLSTQAAYWKKRRDDLLADQGGDDYSSNEDDDDDEEQDVTIGAARVGTAGPTAGVEKNDGTARQIMPTVSKF